MTSTPWGDPAASQSPMQSLYRDEEAQRVRRLILDVVDRLERIDPLLEDLGAEDLARRCHDLACDLDMRKAALAVKAGG